MYENRLEMQITERHRPAKVNGLRNDRSIECQRLEELHKKMRCRDPNQYISTCVATSRNDANRPIDGGGRHTRRRIAIFFAFSNRKRTYPRSRTGHKSFNRKTRAFRNRRRSHGLVDLIRSITQVPHMQ